MVNLQWSNWLQSCSHAAAATCPLLGPCCCTAAVAAQQQQLLHVCQTTCCYLHASAGLVRWLLNKPHITAAMVNNLFEDGRATNNTEWAVNRTETAALGEVPSMCATSKKSCCCVVVLPCSIDLAQDGELARQFSPDRPAPFLRTACCPR
jgi:hypothetical protein